MPAPSAGQVASYIPGQKEKLHEPVVNLSGPNADSGGYWIVSKTKMTSQSVKGTVGIHPGC